MHLLVILSFIGILTTSCSKNEKNEGTSTLSIRMTDAPGNYDSVLIDLQSVEFTGNGGNLMLNVNAGIYNLLDFVNGLDTLIATGTVSSGKVEQLRLILGSNNRVVVNNVSYPLSTPSAQQSGLKLQLHNTFVEGVNYELLLDFDAAQSIVETGSGSYQLKPVIRVVETAISGSINGTVMPAGVQSTITADNGTQSYSTSTDINGNFLLQGIPQGTYNVTITPSAPYSQVTVQNVVVNTGALTNMGVINL